MTPLQRRRAKLNVCEAKADPAPLENPLQRRRAILAAASSNSSGCATLVYPLSEEARHKLYQTILTTITTDGHSNYLLSLSLPPQAVLSRFSLAGCAVLPLLSLS